MALTTVLAVYAFCSNQPPLPHPFFFPYDMIELITDLINCTEPSFMSPYQIVFLLNEVTDAEMMEC